MSPVTIPSVAYVVLGAIIEKASGGVNAALEWNPANGYAIIVLSNYDPPSAERVAQHIRGLLPR